MTEKIRETMVIEGSMIEALGQAVNHLELWWEGDAIQRIVVHKRLLRVLIADDCRDSADSLALLTKLWGYEVRVAYDGVTALQLAYAYRPDVLLLDIGMPKMDGYQVTRHLRGQARFKHTLLIAVTGYADEAHRRLGAAAGFDHYLAKPTDLSTLKELLLLQQHRLALSRRLRRRKQIRVRSALALA